MKRIHLFVPLFFILFSCNNSTKTLPKPFSTDMLAAQLFSIDPGKDTALETLHGSRIRIPAGAFNVSSDVEIEIKEAFTPAEILAAGLTTESNGRPLRSGGMIYINATSDGDSIALIKPIQVSIPNTYYDSAMQVFKGEQTDSAGINWVEPQPTDTTPQMKRWEDGKALFQSKCGSCHRIFASLTGPALGGVDDRWRDRSKLYAWIRYNQQLIASGYPKAVEVSKFSSSEMTAFPNLTDADIDAILFYINNEYNNPAARPEEQRYIDSLNTAYRNACGNDTFYVAKTKSEMTFLNENISSSDTADDETETPEIRQPEDLEGLRRGFTDANPTGGMYDFQIITLGWFNIDALVEGYEGTINAKVLVNLQLPVETRMHLYLFCPTDKTLSVSNEHNGNTYSFNKINGGIPLFRGRRAILFAFGSYKDKMYYGIGKFTIAAEQTITLPVKETTEKEIRDALLSRQMEGIDLGIEKKELKVLERNCDTLYYEADTLRKV